MRKLIVGVLALAVLACGGDKSTSPRATVVGTYTLQTVNGQNLPVTFFQNAEEKDEILSGTVSLNSDGTFTDKSNIRVTITGRNPQTFPFDFAGRYTLNGNNVTFTVTQSGDTYSMAWDGANQLTQAEVGFTLIYQK
jgi:hypothetical protein